MRKFIIIFLFLVLVGASVYLYTVIINKPLSPSDLINKTEEINFKSQINCSDIRAVVEENGKEYIACYGGVIIRDKATGKIEKQISMADGLGNYITTDLIKKGNNLYIGTQDGVTFWDLNKNKATKLSVDEGLPNGANIVIEEDGNFIWIGTFDGIARLNTQNNEIKSFKKEIAVSDVEKLNVGSIAVTKNYVYFSVLASAHSPGTVARYNKNNGEWKRITPADFGDNSQYARLDAFNLCNYNDDAVLVESKTLWKIPSTESTKPEKIFTAGYNDMIRYNFVCSEKGVLFETDTNTLVYDGNSVRALNESVDSQLHQKYLNNMKKDDFRKIFGDTYPGSFNKILGVVENNVVLAAVNGLWFYNTDKDTWGQVAIPETFNFDNLGTNIFWPILGTNKYVLGRQTCGMGCDSPKFFLCTYPNNECASIKIPDDVMKIVAPEETAIGMDFGYSDMFTYSSKEREILSFEVTNSSNKIFNITMDKNLKWTTEKSADESLNNNPLCVKEFSYLLKGNAFAVDKEYCTSGYDGVIAGDYIYKSEDKVGPVRINKDTKVQEKLSPKMTKPSYTPFDEPSWNDPVINKITALDKKIYFSTSRGLWILDTLNSSWKLVSIADGLTSNEVNDFGIAGSNTFVITPAGITTIKTIY